MTPSVILVWAIVIAVSVFIHELGHLRTMQRYGVEVEEMAIGAPVRFLTITTWFGKGANRIRLRLSPILFIGWIKPTERGVMKMERLGTEPVLMIAGAGPYMNLVVASFLIGLLFLTKGAGTTGIVIGIVSLGITGAMIKFPGIFMTRIFPVLGLLMLALALALTWNSLVASGVGSSGSFANLGGLSFTQAVRKFIAFFAAINLVLGAFNLMPLSMLDGGRQATAYMKKWGWSPKFIRAYGRVTAGMLLVIIVVSYAT